MFQRDSSRMVQTHRRWRAIFRTEPVRGRPKIIDRFSQNVVIGDRHVGKEVESKLARYSESSGPDLGGRLLG